MADRGEPARDPRDEGPLLSIQVFRAVAALLVLVYHASHDADALAARAGAMPFDLDRVFDWSFGVELFFVISGYIIVRTARGFGSARGVLRFAMRRIVRVVPLYWLMTSLVIAGASVAPGLLNMPLGGPAVVLGSYAFLPVLREDGRINPVLGQGWTLDYEMFFYALFAAAVCLPRRIGLAALLAALLGLVAVGQVLRPGGAIAGVWTGELLLVFLFGLVLGLLEEAGVRLRAAPALLLGTLGVLAAVGLGPVTPAAGALPQCLRGGVPAALLIGAGVLGPRWAAGPVVLALSAIGDASYSLYLSHPFAVRLMRVAWERAAPPDAPPSLYLAVACLGAVAASLPLHRFVERPMTLWLAARSRSADDGARPVLPDAALRGN